MLFICIVTHQGRKSFSKASFYFAYLVFLVLITPHFIWAFISSFSGMSYINASFDENKLGWLSHIYYPLRYLRGQALIMLGLLILTWPFWFSIFKKSDKKENNTKNINKGNNITIARFDKVFVLMMGLAPIIFTVLYAAFTGKHILQRWSTSYYYLSGLVVVILFRPSITKEKLNKFLVTVFIVFFSVCLLRNGSFVIGPKLTNKARADAYLPNKAIAGY